MILRIARGRVLAGREKEFVDIVRRQAASGARLPGLLSFMTGYRRVDRTDHFIMASGWVDEASVIEAVGPEPIDRPASVGVMAAGAVIDQVMHYELVEPISRGMLDAPGAVLRSIEATIAPGGLPELMARVRQIDRQFNVINAVLGFAIGTREVAGREVVHSVTAWASPLQIEQLAEEGRAGKVMFASLDDLLSDVTIEQYQAIELRLPEELADVGGLRVIAARFASQAAAAAAESAMKAAFSSARESGIYVARLGGSGGGSGGGGEQQHLLVARTTLADHFGAERLIADLGGQVVYEADERAGGAPPATGLQRSLSSI